MDRQVAGTGEVSHLYTWRRAFKEKRSVERSFCSCTSFGYAWVGCRDNGDEDTEVLKKSHPV